MLPEAFESSMARLGSLLRERIGSRNSCHMVFFPSFVYLKAGLAAYEEDVGRGAGAVSKYYMAYCTDR